MINYEQIPKPNLSYTNEEEIGGQKVLGEWAKPHTNELLSVLPYNPDKYPFQPLDVIYLEPNTDIEKARQIGELGIGKVAYDALVDDLRRYGLINEIKQRGALGKSALMASLHFRNIIDTPLGHNASLIASEDERFADMNVMLANHMVKRLQIGGIAVAEIIQMSGVTIYGHPLNGALKYGMNPDITQSGNRALAPIFRYLLESGVLLHTAPSETRAKNIILKDGRKAKMIPLTKDSFAGAVKKRMPLAAALAMDIKPGNGIA
ncbi:hypothetical protein KW801_02105, partial [Candidatus Saccharibacteria bacterium]|nr:hypothetical protein [Candidatus Saccharibacteria bacterium]